MSAFTEAQREAIRAIVREEIKALAEAGTLPLDMALAEERQNGRTDCLVMSRAALARHFQQEAERWEAYGRTGVLPPKTAV